MKMINFILYVLVIVGYSACGQTTQQKSKLKTEKMNTDKLTNSTVKKAVEALDSNDNKAWFALFSDDIIFTDDGNKKDFKSFFENAFNHKEKFLSFDKIENDGKDLYGEFFAGQWGTFNTYFKFQINTDGKINRLDIGQN